MLILASASQSRKKLLENSKFEFIQIVSNFDESLVKEKNISNLAVELSYQKSISLCRNMKKEVFQKSFNHSSLEILGCDSLFEFKGKVFGKPSSKDEAYNRWSKMSGEFGFLHTGHTLLLAHFDLTSREIKVTKKIQKTISSKVYFSRLREEEIKSYVDSLEPLYCAGGFALEGIGAKYIERIEGCFSNVMGLSLPWLRMSLIKEGIFS